MSRSGLIFPLCCLLVSGCALSEDPEMAPQKSELASAVTERQSMPPPPAIDSATLPTVKAALTKTFSPEEIRRLQWALKDLGFDPGPADGIARNKTKVALERLQAGCAQVTPVIENASDGEGSTPQKSYTRAETFRMQAELRRAGFNVGPLDGIYGSRTRAVMGHLRSLCPAMPDYASLLPSPAGAAAKAEAVSTAAPLGVKAVKTVSPPPPSRSQEEIRILQLRLRDAGFDPGAFDGLMGPKTEKALLDYQAAHRAGKVKASLTMGTSSTY